MSITGKQALMYLIGAVLIYLAMYLLPRLEERILSRARNMNVYVAYRSPENISIITDSLREQQVQIYDVETCPAEGARCGAVLLLHLPVGVSHISLLGDLSELACVQAINEM